MMRLKLLLSLSLFGFTVLLYPFLLACGAGAAPVEFAIKHLRDETGEKITEVVSYRDEAGLDNTSGTAPLQVQIQFERNYRYQLIERLETQEISSKSVQDRIVEQ